MDRGISWEGGFGGPGPRVTKGAPKKGKGKKTEKNKRKRKGKKGTKRERYR